MTIFFDRIDSAPLANNEFSFDFNQWISVLVDTLNEVIISVQNAFNLLHAQSYTAAEISNLNSSGQINDGVILYDSTNNVYVGKISGILVKFVTASYP